MKETSQVFQSGVMGVGQDLLEGAVGERLNSRRHQKPAFRCCSLWVEQVRRGRVQQDKVPKAGKVRLLVGVGVAR